MRSGPAGWLIGEEPPSQEPRTVWQHGLMAPTGPTEGDRLVEQWRSWVREIEDHPLDQYEYLGALEHRDQVETWLQTSGDQVAMNAVSEIDALFERVTCEDGRFAHHFIAHSGAGWWWKRMPSDPEAQRYIVQDWRF